MQPTAPTSIPPSLRPRTEIRVFVQGVLSILYDVILGGVWSLMEIAWLSRGFQGNLFDLGTGLMGLLAIASGAQIATGIGLSRNQRWAVPVTYGICVTLLLYSALGMALNLCLDNEVVAIPITSFLWSIVLNFVPRPRNLAKSLHAPRN
jgi:hypothetical protein